MIASRAGRQGSNGETIPPASHVFVCANDACRLRYSSICFSFEGSDTVQLPPRGKSINLNMIQINDTSVYGLVFNHLRTLWHSQVKLVSKTADWRAGKPFVATAVQSFSHAIVNGTQFGACTSYRGKGTSFAYIDGRVAVRIQYILSVKHDRRDPTLAVLSTAFAIVERFTSAGIPPMPWENRYVIISQRSHLYY